MKKNVDLLELFSGIGGFALGLKNAGFSFKNHYYSEIDKHAIANYKYNFKNATYVGSVTDVRNIIHTINKNRSSKLVITFGSPCQDFSVAGKGTGLEGSKSSLIKYALFLIKWLRPDVFIWENVKGAFSTNNGADYWAIIQAFTNINGYRCEQQLLNASWLLPQNRERIYLIGHLTGSSEPGVFPFTENDTVFNIEANTEKGRPQAKYSSTLKSSGSMKADDTFVSVPKTAGCLTGGGHSGRLHSDMTVIPVCGPDIITKNQNGRRFKESGDPSFTLSCQDRHGIMIQSNTKKGYDVTTKEDTLNLSVPNSKTRRGRVGKGVAQTLDTDCNQGVIVKVIPEWVNVRKYEVNIKKLQSVLKEHKALTNQEIALKLNISKTTVDHWFRTDKSFSIPEQNIWHQLKELLKIKTDEFDSSITQFELKESVFEKSNRVYDDKGISPTITSTSANERIIVNKKNYIQWDESGKGHNSQQDRAFYGDGNMGCIPSTRTENKVNVLLNDAQIRRLTEIECERLQGFPDDFTKYGIYEKQVWINKKEKTFKIIEDLHEIPKTQRYKLCGNAVTSTIVKIIGLRLKLKN